jgi:hypothetical protein
MIVWSFWIGHLVTLAGRVGLGGFVGGTWSLRQTVPPPLAVLLVVGRRTDES